MISGFVVCLITQIADLHRRLRVLDRVHARFEKADKVLRDSRGTSSSPLPVIDECSCAAFDKLADAGSTTEAETTEFVERCNKKQCVRPAASQPRAAPSQPKAATADAAGVRWREQAARALQQAEAVLGAPVTLAAPTRATPPTDDSARASSAAPPPPPPPPLPPPPVGHQQMVFDGRYSRTSQRGSLTAPPRADAGVDEGLGHSVVCA